LDGGRQFCVIPAIFSVFMSRRDGNFVLFDVEFDSGAKVPRRITRRRYGDLFLLFLF
jgi:hypothetical protein